MKLLWWWEMRISPTPIWKRGDVRKATGFTEEVNVVSIMQDPPKQCGWKEKGGQVAFGSAYRGNEGYRGKRVKFVRTKERAQKKRQQEGNGAFFTKSAQHLRASQKAAEFYDCTCRPAGAGSRVILALGYLCLRPYWK